MSELKGFERWVRRWGLEPDGAPILTHSSRLMPVRRGPTSAMLKVAVMPEERAGAALMVWWGGEGAARVLEHEGEALLLERAEDALSLAETARGGRDQEATLTLCAAAARLHGVGGEPPSTLVPLERWFAALEAAARTHGGVLAASANAAQALLAAPRDLRVLHGDIHHGNVLYFGQRGWLAIDPKGLLGERGFDYANLFCNPDLETAVAQFHRRVPVVTEATGLESGRLLQWILAWSGLSAAWSLEDSDQAETALTIATLAANELGG